MLILNAVCVSIWHTGERSRAVPPVDVCLNVLGRFA
jgi:hypothetical protein